MINNGKKLQSFERELTKKGKVDFRANFGLVEAMFAEAVALGTFPLKDPLSGIDVDIRIAKAVNRVQKSP
jgi:hypothetical protein